MVLEAQSPEHAATTGVAAALAPHAAATAAVGPKRAGARTVNVNGIHAAAATSRRLEADASEPGVSVPRFDDQGEPHDIPVAEHGKPLNAG